MNRSEKIRRIYGEFRSALEDKAASKEVLKSAALLVDIYKEREKYTDHPIGKPRRTFEEMPLDKAFADCGWRVMHRERGWLNKLFSEEKRHPLIAEKITNYGIAA